MLNIYDSFRDENGFQIPGRTKLFITKTLEDGSIHESHSGLAFTTEENGTLFIVDEFIIDQMHKVQFKDGVLSVKDGEEIIEPVLTDLEKQELELERQLAELRAKKETNNIE